VRDVRGRRAARIADVLIAWQTCRQNCRCVNSVADVQPELHADVLIACRRVNSMADVQLVIDLVAFSLEQVEH
jgi:hypothetical protein